MFVPVGEAFERIENRSPCGVFVGDQLAVVVHSQEVTHLHVLIEHLGQDIERHLIAAGSRQGERGIIAHVPALAGGQLAAELAQSAPVDLAGEGQAGYRQSRDHQARVLRVLVIWRGGPAQDHEQHQRDQHQHHAQQ